jgi:transposase
MSKAHLVITAVITEGLSQGEAARRYGVSQGWISRLLARYRCRGRGGVRAAVAAAEDLPEGDQHGCG